MEYNKTGSIFDEEPIMGKIEFGSKMETSIVWFLTSGKSNARLKIPFYDWAMVLNTRLFHHLYDLVIFSDYNGRRMPIQPVKLERLVSSLSPIENTYSKEEKRYKEWKFASGQDIKKTDFIFITILGESDIDLDFENGEATLFISEGIWGKKELLSFEQILIESVERFENPPTQAEFVEMLKELGLTEYKEELD